MHEGWNQNVSTATLISVALELQTWPISFQIWDLVYAAITRWKAIFNLLGFCVWDTLLQLGRTMGKKKPNSIRTGLRISHEELSEMVGATRPMKDAEANGFKMAEEWIQSRYLESDKKSWTGRK
jgi:hypothetical protein